MQQKHLIGLLLSIFLTLNVPSFAEELVISQKSTLLKQLQSLTQGNAKFSIAKDGTIRFISIQKGATINQPFNGVASSNPTKVAINFLSEYKVLFGTDYKPEYKLIKDTITGSRHSIKLQQNYNGIPVFAGEMVVRLNPSLDVTGANGVIASKLNVSVKPLINKEIAKENAITAVQKSNLKNGLGRLAITANEPTLWIYNPKLLGKKNNINKLAWRVDVSDTSRMKSNQYIFIDAITGNPLNRISNIHEAKNRNIHDLANDNTGTYPSNLPGPIARTEGQTSSGVTDVNNAYDFFGDTYDFYLSTHNRDSIDGAGMTLKATVRYCDNTETCPYANAAWVDTLSQMVFGAGFTVDDVTSHEITHGVTSRTSNLIYQDQSGAINESFSDVWGEFVDLSNNAGNDTASVRWQMGEDIGAFRSMKDPTLFTDPDKVTSPNYYCGTGDSGGVHTNSGVNNKATYLIVDGDTFNGFTVNGIGITKTAKIYYEAQTNILTSGSTYPDLYNALNAACNTLVGTTANITTANCTEVKKALDAVEMYHTPCTGPLPAPICPSDFTPNYLIKESFEGGLNGWTHSTTTGIDAWSLSSTSPNTGTKHIHGENDSNISDSSIRSNFSLSIPANAYLRFAHSGAFESGYDGGVVEYTTDNGTTWNDTDTLFSHNGYTDILNTAFNNPLAGRKAFTGDFSGTYKTSRIDLNNLAGSTVDFRFRIGTDNSVGATGWDIDDIDIYTCLPPSPEITSPATESTLSSSTEIFIINSNGITLTNWNLRVGTTIGANDIANRFAGSSSNSMTISGLPTDGSTLYVRLQYKEGGIWKIAGDYSYTAFSQVALPLITSPVSGSTFSGSIETFALDSNGIALTNWNLRVGTTVGSSDIANRFAGSTSNSITINGLPTDSSTLYVRLQYKEGGIWKIAGDYSYTASPQIALPLVTSPVSGSTLSGSTETFTLDSNAIALTNWNLRVGTTIGANDIANRFAGSTSNSITISGLPTDSSTLYVRLQYKEGGLWKIAGDYTYTASSQVALPLITSPVSGSTFSSSTETFALDSNAITLTNWNLRVGTTIGANNIANRFAGSSSSSITISGLPTNGSTLYVRLQYKEGGIWKIAGDYSYTSSN